MTNKSGNRRRTVWAAMKTKMSSIRAHAKNVSFRRLFREPIRTPGMPNYVEPIVYVPKIKEYIRGKTWDEKIFERFKSPKALTEQKRAKTLYMLKCIENKLVYEFSVRSNQYPSTSRTFWANRYDNLDDTEVALNEMTLKQCAKKLMVEKDISVNKQILPTAQLSKDEYHVHGQTE